MQVNKAGESDGVEYTTIEWGHMNEIPEEGDEGIHQVHSRMAVVLDAESAQ